MPSRLLRKSWLIKSIFFICAFIILLIGGITYRSINNLSQSSALLTQTHKVNVELGKIFSYLKDAETGQQGFIITNDPIYLRPYNVGRENINSSFAELKELGNDNPAFQNELKELNTLIDTRMEYFEKAFRFSSVGNYNNENFTENFYKGKATMDTIGIEIQRMIDSQNELLQKRQQDYESDLKVTPMFLYMVLLISLLLMFLAYTKIIRDLKKIKAVNEQLEIFKESTNQSQIISQHGNWILNVDDKTFEFSDNVYRLLGEEPQSFKASLENFLHFIHRDDQDKLKADISGLFENNYLPFIYFRIIDKNGILKHFKAFGKEYKNAEGKKKVLGTISDITEEVEHFKILEERN